MSDLISRKALYNELLRLEELARNRVLDTPLSSPCYARYTAQLNERTRLKHLVADAPTAYDVNEVVEQLQQMKTRYFLTIANTGNETLDKIYEDVGNSIDKAIEIAKGAVKHASHPQASNQGR